MESRQGREVGISPEESKSHPAIAQNRDPEPTGPYLSTHGRRLRTSRGSSRANMASNSLILDSRRASRRLQYQSLNRITARDATTWIRIRRTPALFRKFQKIIQYAFTWVNSSRHIGYQQSGFHSSD